MKELKKLLVLSMVVGLWPVAAQAVIQIRPTSAQDGDIFNPDPSPNVDSSSGFGRYGSSSGVLWTQVGIHTLPAVTAAQIGSAELRIPQTDNAWGGATDVAQDTETWSATHIDATNDAAIDAADRSSAALGNLGVWRAPGARHTNGQGHTAFDVTAAVMADLTAGRASFAWRLDTDSIAVPDASMYFPTVDNTDGYFGTFDLDPTTDNHGARLLITLVPEPATAGLMLLGGLGLLRRRR
jgi:hypothetical protein